MRKRGQLRHRLEEPPLHRVSIICGMMIKPNIDANILRCKAIKFSKLTTPEISLDSTRKCFQEETGQRRRGTCRGFRPSQRLLVDRAAFDLRHHKSSKYCNVSSEYLVMIFLPIKSLLFSFIWQSSSIFTRMVDVSLTSLGSAF